MRAASCTTSMKRMVVVCNRGCQLPGPTHPPVFPPGAVRLCVPAPRTGDRAVSIYSKFPPWLCRPGAGYGRHLPCGCPLPGLFRVSWHAIALAVPYRSSNGKLPACRYVLEVVDQYRAQTAKLPTVQTVSIPDGTRLTVCGDTHGQLEDLFSIFTINGPPSATNAVRLHAAVPCCVSSCHCHNPAWSLLGPRVYAATAAAGCYCCCCPSVCGWMR